MYGFRILASLSLVSTLSFCALGDTIQATDGSSGSWQNFPTTLNQQGSVYWDNPSRDGSQKNIGYWLSGTGAFASYTGGCYAVNPCVTGSPGDVPEWFGNASTGSEISTETPNFDFVRNSAQYTLTVQVVLSFWTPATEFGWYDPTTMTLHPLFDGTGVNDGGAALTAGSSIGFNPNVGVYGFYIKDLGVGQTFFTQTNDNTFYQNENQHQHFSVFGTSLAPGAETYYIGAKDSWVSSSIIAGDPTSEGLGDFNDIIISMQPVLVPEPSTAWLVFAGLFGLVCMKRLRLRPAESSARQR